MIWVPAPFLVSSSEKTVSADEMEPSVTDMWSHARKVRSLANIVLGSTRIGTLRGSARSRVIRPKHAVCAARSSPRLLPFEIRLLARLEEGRIWPRSGCPSSSSSSPLSAEANWMAPEESGGASDFFLPVRFTTDGAEALTDSRIDTSSIQYGAAATSSVRRTAPPWMNLENLYTSVHMPPPRRSWTHCAGFSTSPCSFTSRIAWGKWVCSEALTGLRSSRRHRSVIVDAYPQVSSRTMARFVSSEIRTEESNGIWKAVRMYWVRTVGPSCLLSITRAICENSLHAAWMSVSFLPLRFMSSANSLTL
mmetsp:Transcript_22465/g.53900  ORF Transcript_22465/g.53900 Transcript_22465/m.53900 type:complete len:307 (-) Transcript_22465:1792-2712(-)